MYLCLSVLGPTVPVPVPVSLCPTVPVPVPVPVLVSLCPSPCVLPADHLLLCLICHLTPVLSHFITSVTGLILAPRFFFTSGHRLWAMKHFTTLLIHKNSFKKEMKQNKYQPQFSGTISHTPNQIVHKYQHCTLPYIFIPNPRFDSTTAWWQKPAGACALVSCLLYPQMMMNEH